jgi:tyrosyl-tRNA synthetase
MARSGSTPSCSAGLWDFWQYWRNTEDADVGRFLKLFTTLPMDEIGRLEALEGAEINEAKKGSPTRRQRCCMAGRRPRKPPKPRARPSRKARFRTICRPSRSPHPSLHAGIGLLALFVRAGLAGSNGEARRHVQGGAIRINDVSISDDKTLVNAGYLNDDGVIKLSLGKKKHVLVRPQ